jgi:hypothetical protein
MPLGLQRRGVKAGGETDSEEGGHAGSRFEVSTTLGACSSLFFFFFQQEARDAVATKTT